MRSFTTLDNAAGGARLRACALSVQLAGEVDSIVVRCSVKGGALRAIMVVAAVALGALTATEGSTAAAKPSDDVVLLGATLSGRGLAGGDLRGRGTVGLQLHRLTGQLCFRMRVEKVPKGVLFVARGDKTSARRPVLSLLPSHALTGKRAPHRRGSQTCLKHVSSTLISEMAQHPGRFFVALTSRGFRRLALRGRLSRRLPGAQSTGGISTCKLTLYDDTGMNLFGEGYLPPNGIGTPHVIGPISGGNPVTGDGCYIGSTGSANIHINSIDYSWAYQAYVNDPVYASNEYYCHTQGVIRCLGPQPGSVLSGWTLSVIYYLCTPAQPANPACRGPTAAITIPAAGASYALGQRVYSSFTCTDYAGGPGITKCWDQNGNPSGALIDTLTVGEHTFTVTATNKNGQIGHASVTYTVQGS
jgi:hypothetical protein